MFACLLILVIPSYSGLFISFSSDFFFLCTSIYIYSLPHVCPTYLYIHAGVSLSCTDIHTHVQSRRRKQVFTLYVYVVAYGSHHWCVSISAGSVMRLKAEMLVTETNMFKTTVGMIIKFTLRLFLRVKNIQRKLRKTKQNDTTNSMSKSPSWKVNNHSAFLPPPHGATAPSGPRPPHYRGFKIILRHTTLGRTPLDRWQARPLADNTQLSLRTSMTPAGFEPANPASERPQTRALDRAAVHYHVQK